MQSELDLSKSKSRRPGPIAQPARRAGFYLALLLGGYFLLAYIAIPTIWRGYERFHPALKDAQEITVTGDKHPGDPINIGLIGTDNDLRSAMQTAGWKKADALGLKSDVSIAVDTLLDRAYLTAPVSNLYYWGRKEDLAFEMPAAKSPSKRHHVRFWKSKELDHQGRPLWMGAATFDKSVGLSHTTGQITHHIDGNVDAERSHILDTLTKAGCVSNDDWVENFHKTLEGKNGGGDRWHTDGRLVVVTLRSATKSDSKTGP